MAYDRDDRNDARTRNDGYRSPPGRDVEREYDRPGEPDRGRYRSAGYGDNPRGRTGYGRPPQGYDYEDRGFFDRAGDEVRSWFGDEEAERRRRYDERYAQREYERDQARSDRSVHGREGYGSATPYFDTGLGIPYAGYGLTGGSPDRNRERDHDPHYRSWRDRQMEALDRDYDDYRREHQSKFDSEFAGWRGKRQGQRDQLQQVREHHEVVGSDGQHVGKVDHVRGDRILLAKNDAGAGGHHHSIPSSWITGVGEKVEIDRTAAQAQKAWKDEEDNSAIGGGQSGNSWSEDRQGGPRNLNRSFSGTY